MEASRRRREGWATLQSCTITAMASLASSPGALLPTIATQASLPKCSALRTLSLMRETLLPNPCTSPRTPAHCASSALAETKLTAPTPLDACKPKLWSVSFYLFAPSTRCSYPTYVRTDVCSLRTALPTSLLDLPATPRALKLAPLSPMPTTLHSSP